MYKLNVVISRGGIIVYMIEMYCLIGASVFLSLCAVFAVIFFKVSMNRMRKELKSIKQEAELYAGLRNDYINIIWQLVHDVDILKKVKKDKKREVEKRNEFN